MFIAMVVGGSLLLQAFTTVLAWRLISITGRKMAWILLSFGIATMAARRLMTFVDLLTGRLIYQPDAHFDILAYEIIGLVGSAIMLAGVVYVKPVFVSIKNSEMEQRQLAGELKEAFANIKTLRGMLPICASCKKIRDDKGYWNQIESYIRRHTEAEFSHGICPECAKKLYPEYFKD